MIMTATTFTSCSKDDDPKDNTNQNEATTTSSELVGKWYFSYEGETDYSDYFIFKSDGTGTYFYDYDQSDDFTYHYNSKSKTLDLNFKHWEPESCSVEWLGKDYIDIDGYGTYVRK